MIFEDIIGSPKPESESLDEIWKKFKEICDLGGVDEDEEDNLKELVKLFEQDPSVLGMSDEELEEVRKFLMEGLDDYIKELKEDKK